MKKTTNKNVKKLGLGALIAKPGMRIEKNHAKGIVGGGRNFFLKQVEAMEIS